MLEVEEEGVSEGIVPSNSPRRSLLEVTEKGGRRAEGREEGRERGREGGRKGGREGCK